MALSLENMKSRPWALVSIDFHGLAKQWATKNLTIPYSSGSSKFFEGRLSAEPVVSTAFSFDSLTFYLRNISLSITNGDRFQDIEIDRILDGAAGTIYIWADGLDWAEIESDGIIFKGIFSKVSHDLFEYSFELIESPLIQIGAIPETTINKTNWPLHRTEGGSGSVAGMLQALVYGDWPKGIPLRCVNTTSFIYAAMAGAALSVDSEYTSTAENVYDNAGAVISAAGFTFYPTSTDGEGTVVSVFDFTSDQINSEPLSCSIRGAYDPSGEITGTAGAIIEHPADIIHDIIKNHTETASSDISIDSIVTMRLSLPGYRFAAIVNKEASAIDVIDRILAQCLYGRTQRLGKVAFVGIHPDAPVTYRAKRSLQIGKTLSITRTPDSTVCNQLLIQYGLNPTTGQYESEVYFDKDNNDRCRQSVWQYGARPQKTIKLPDVQNTGTAVAIANRHLDLFLYRHDIVERITPTIYGFDVLEGDAAELDISEGPSADGSGWAGEKFILLDRTIHGAVAKHRWWRVSV